jgi:predicted TIM-barrel enzyme
MKSSSLCDVNVKHGSHFIISDRDNRRTQAQDAESEGAEILIVTGFETGKAPTPEKVKRFSESVKVPVIIGSGLTEDNASELLSFADGAIVGSFFKEENNWKNPVDGKRVGSFMKKIRSLRRELSDD